MNNHTDIIELLSKDKLISEEDKIRSLEILNAEPTESSPWFVQLLTGFGAWIAAVMFVLFFAVSGIVDDHVGAIVAGIILLVIALLVSIRSQQPMSIFPDQLLLATSLTGHALVIGGLALEFEKQLYIAAIVAVLLSLCFLFLYQNRPHKFISTWILSGGLWVLATELGIQPIVCMALLVVLVAALSAWMWMKESHYLTGRWKSIGRPVQYALTIALLAGERIVERFYSIFWYSGSWTQGDGITTIFPYLKVVSVGLFLVLVYVIITILKRLKIDWKSIIGAGLLVFALILSFVFYQSPSIIAALIVLLIGIERGNRILVPLAIIGLIYFYSDYYYSMDMTLMKKSLILMGSGLFMLAGGWLASRMGDRS